MMDSKEFAERIYLQDKLARLNLPVLCHKRMWEWLNTIYRLMGYDHALATVKGWGGEL